MRCSGLTLLVGPNSSGKTQLLRDLSYRMSGQPRDPVVAKAVRLGKPELEPLLESLAVEGYLEGIGTGGAKRFRPLTPYWGSGEQVQPDFTFNQIQQWYEDYSNKTDARIISEGDEFLRRFMRLLMANLYLERRLASMNKTNTIDLLRSPIQHELHALSLNDEAQEALSGECLRAFKKGVWLDPTQGNVVQIRVKDNGLPDEKDRRSPTKMEKHRPIEDEGDGLKSFVTIAVALLLRKHPVCLIDEPEMCLHPPQARELGRLIGRYGSSLETATIVATHSSEILRGALEERQDFQIIRLTRKDGQFSAHLLEAERLTSAFARPTTRSESVLDGIFAESVVVVEGDGDRLLYQAVWQNLAGEVPQDVHLSPVGGTGGIADPCKLYRSLNIPVGVIADLDMIMDLPKLKQVLDAIAPAQSQPLHTEARRIADRVRKLPPTVTLEAVRKEIQSILVTEVDWAKDGDLLIRSALDTLSRKIAVQRQLKRFKYPSFPEDLRRDIDEYLAKLKDVGAFLVPVGELEDWLPNENLGSRDKKWAFANAAAAWIQSNSGGDGQLYDFVRDVAKYLGRVATTSRPA